MTVKFDVVFLGGLILGIFMKFSVLEKLISEK